MRRLLLFALLLCGIPAHAISTIARTGQCAGTNACTLQPHLPGDVFVAFAYNGTNTTVPTTPVGWTLVSSLVGTSSARGEFCKTAQSSSESATGFTNATGTIVLQYRGALVNSPDCSQSVGGSANGNAASSTVSYNTFTLTNTNGTSWVIGCAGSKTATNMGTAPTGMTNVTTANGGTVGCQDTNNPVSVWATGTASVNASTEWISLTIEIKACTTGPCVRGLVIGSAAGSSGTVASPATVHTAGRKLIAFINNNTPGTNVTGVANTAADTWALCAGSREATVGHVEFWETTSIPNGNAADIVTATFGTNDTLKNIGVYETTGLLTTACETAAVGSGTATGTFTTASFSPAGGGNYNIAGTFSSTNITATAGAGYTLNCCTSNGLEHRFSAPAGSQTASVTLSPNSNTGISVASFKALSSGAGQQVGAFLVGF